MSTVHEPVQRLYVFEEKSGAKDLFDGDGNLQNTVKTHKYIGEMELDQALMYFEHRLDVRLELKYAAYKGVRSDEGAPKGKAAEHKEALKMVAVCQKKMDKTLASLKFKAIQSENQDDVRAKMKAEILAEIKAEMAAEAKEAKPKAATAPKATEPAEASEEEKTIDPPKAKGK